jgi:TRAP-type C4-dicarboxylate transport system substrate-binding protein
MVRTQAQINAQKRYYEKTMNNETKRKELYTRMKEYNKKYIEYIKQNKPEIYEIKKEKARQYAKNYYHNNINQVREKNKLYYHIKKNQTTSNSVGGVELVGEEHST